MCRHPQNALSASLFGNGNSAHRWRKVAARAHPIPDLVEISHQIFAELLKRLSIYPGRARIRFDHFVGVVHNFLSMLNGFVLVASIASSCFQLHVECSHLTRSLCSDSITESSSLVRIDPPQCSTSVLSPRGFNHLCFSLCIEATGSCSSD